MTTLADIAPPSGRWTPKAKAAAVQAVEQGHVTRAAVVAAFDLTDEEFTGWRRDWLRAGQTGLTLKLSHAARRRHRLALEVRP